MYEINNVSGLSSNAFMSRVISQLENMSIANALQFEGARRRAVPIRFNFGTRAMFELAQPIRCRFRAVSYTHLTLPTIYSV